MVKKSRIIKRRVDTSSGVSETIGAILLVSLVVLAVAVIAAALLGQPLPEKTPNVHFIASTNETGTTLYLYHDSGETINTSQFSLMINEKPRYNFAVDGGGDAWSVGKNLVVDLSDQKGGYIVPNTVKIVYGSGSSQVVLDQANLQAIVTTTMVPDVMPTPTPICPTNCNIANCSQDEIGDAYTQIVLNTSIIFERSDSKTDLGKSGTLYFRVTNAGSVLATREYGLTNLDIGDIVSISLVSKSKDLTIFGLGDKFFFLRGEGVDLSLVSQSNPLKNFNTNVNLDNGWITGYVDLGSTFTIDSTSVSGQDPYTLLVVNGTKIYNEYNHQKITISNIHPIGVGLFDLEWDSNGQPGVNFAGSGTIT